MSKSKPAELIDAPTPAEIPVPEKLPMPSTPALTPTPTAPPAAKEIPMSLDEFCRRLSMEDRRSTLIGGFHYTQRRANHLSDIESTYRAAFDAFCKK